MTINERERYRIVVASDVKRDLLTVELTIGEEIEFEFFVQDGELKLGIYTEYGKPPVITRADVFQEAVKAAYGDALTLPGLSSAPGQLSAPLTSEEQD